MYVDYETISTHLNIKKGIDFLKNLKNRENKFSKNFWNSDIYNTKIYNNYIRTVPYFWLNNDKYTINNVYELNELNDIPWYYDFRLYEDVLENLEIIDKKNLWNNFDYSEINKSNEKHYIANKDILKTYIPRGYIIPPFDKNILNINIKKINETDDKTKLYDKNKITNDKYTEIDNDIKEFITDNVHDFFIITNIAKIKKIAEKNFDLLDIDGDNVINFNELQKLYLNLDNIDKDIIESFADMIQTVNDDTTIKDKLIKDNIYLDDDNNINKKNYINSVTISYIKSENFDKIMDYNRTINTILVKNLSDKIKIMENESLDKNNSNTGDNNDDSLDDNDNLNEENLNNDNSDIKINNDIHENTWKETLIKIGLWTIGIITIISILIFILFVFIFNNNDNTIDINQEIINNDIPLNNLN